MLFQILDDSKIKDSNGNIVRFDNVIILMTSNIGFNDINIGFNKKEEDLILSKLIYYTFLNFYYVSSSKNIVKKLII